MGVVVSGRAGFELSDGSCFEVGPDAVYEVPPGHDGWVIGDESLVVIEWTGITEWLMLAHGERVLTTLLFTDIVDSTRHANRLGDRGWRELLAAHDEALRELIANGRGREVKATGDGFLALFDGPARAIQTAVSIRHRARSLGLELRQAVHVGEVEVAGSDVRGIAVHEAARVVTSARPGEILESSTTRLLASGSGHAFEDRGPHALRGLPGMHQLFAVLEGPAGGISEGATASSVP